MSTPKKDTPAETPKRPESKPDDSEASPESKPEELDGLEVTPEENEILERAKKKEPPSEEKDNKVFLMQVQWPPGDENQSSSSKEKGKGAGKPKATAKPKAANKGKPKTGTKRKKKGEEPSEDEPPPKKIRAKGKKTQEGDPDKKEDENEKKKNKEEEPKKTKMSLKKQTETWQKKLEEDENTETKEAEFEIDTEEIRDRQKAQKYTKLERQGALPNVVREAMEAADKSTNPRAAKTNLINRLFKKEGNNFVMVPNDPSFQRVQKHLDTKYGQEENIGIPYNLMLWEKFHGNKVALQQAIDDGDIALSSYKGKEYLSFTTVTQGRKKSMVESTELMDGAHKLNEEEHGQIEDSLKKLAQGVEGCLQIGTTSGSGGEKGSQVLMLKDQQAQPKWEAVEQVLIQAKQAQEKLIRESMKLKDKIIKAGDGELTKAFKDSLAILQDNDRKLDHIIMWKAGLGTLVVFFPTISLQCFFGVVGQEGLREQAF